MNTSVTLDKAGRIVLPKGLRDHLHLEPGDTLDLDADGQTVTLTPRRDGSPMRKELGIWVFRGSRKLSSATTEKVLQGLRNSRSDELFKPGPSRP